MSDPVSKIEIEDVLSSIRRLVSEENRVEPRRVYTRERSEQPRLVLTPALRVAEAEDTQDEAEATEAPQPEASAVVNGAEPWSDPNATLFETARRQPQTADAEEVETDDGDAWHEAEFEASDAAEDLDDEYDDEPAEDASETADIVVEAREDALFVDDVDGDEDTAAFETVEETSVDDFHDDLDASEAERAETLSSKIHALEAAIGKTDDQWEPDDEGVDDYAGTRVETIEWEDHAADKEPIRPVFGRVAAPQEPESDQDLLADDEAILDEESLRELVAEIVREELQGALGERITRNVRKLVRREIHRALTAQELE